MPPPTPDIHRLRDGSEVEIRPIVPEDREELALAFARLSRESRYRRFLSPMAHLSASTLSYLTQVDHHDHEALVAFPTDTREGIGVARYVRLPDRPNAAECAVTVADAWQGRGLGSLLLDHLVDRAREEGVEVFTAVVFSFNDDMLHLFRRLGPSRVIDRHAGTVEIEAVLPAEGVGAHLGGLLRVAGRHAAAEAEGAEPG